MEVIISGFIKSKVEVEDISSMFNLKPDPYNPGLINVANFTATKTGNFVQISFDLPASPSPKSYDIPFIGGLFPEDRIFYPNYVYIGMMYANSSDGMLTNSQLTTGMGDMRINKTVVFCFSVV